MKSNALAVFCFLICFLAAVPSIASASDNPEAYVATLDSKGYSNYMESLGEGLFTPQEFLGRPSGYQYGGNYYSYGNGIGDFDNDGDLDYIMASTFDSKSIYLFEKLGPGKNFALAVKVGVWGEGNIPSAIPMDMAVADFNEDGNLDFILVEFYAGYCELYTGDGHLGFTASVIPPDADAVAQNYVGADAADFNNDGHVDFVVAPYMSYDDPIYFYVYLGHGDGTFTTVKVQTHESATYWGVAAGDFDRDGIADLVATDRGTYDVYLGNGDGTFEFGNRFNDPALYYYAPVDNYDFNGDQIQDIVIGRYGTPDGVGVFLGDGEGGFVYAGAYIGGSTGERYAISTPPYMQNKSPVAVVEPAYQEITSGEAVFFDGQGSYDEDGEIVGYAWDFGEQSITLAQTSDQSITLAQTSDQSVSAQHVYYEVGLYTITLTVTDDKGATHSVQAQVRVKPLEVKIKFTPQILNSKSKGRWVQAIIWLPEGYDASQIDLNSLCIVENQTPLVYADSSHQGKKFNKYFNKYFKKKHARTLKVKFDRQALLAALSGPAGVKTLHVQGELLVAGMLSQNNPGSISFDSSDTIRIIEPRKKHKPDKKYRK